MVLALILLLSTLSFVTGFIIPEELPSLLSLLYSNIPPVKKGTDSRVGIGFRLGPHADFQIMLEVGPQSNTAPIGPDGEPPGKRDTLKMQNPQTLLDIIRTWKLPLPHQTEEPMTVEDSPAAETIDSTPGSSEKMETGSSWLSSWRDAIAQNSLFGKIQFKPVQGIDYRIDSGKIATRYIVKSPIPKPEIETLSYVDQLSQLYTKPSHAQI